MVDAIGSNRVATGDLARVTTTKTAPAAPVASVQSAGETAARESVALSKVLSSTPPVDTNRVAEIRKAIANGTFPILPATIADRMLALKMDWSTNDQA